MKKFSRKWGKSPWPASAAVFLPYTATHYPTRPHPDFVGKTGNGSWTDLLYQIDIYTGRLLETIDDLGIRDNTIFIFTADNEPEATLRGTDTHEVSTPSPGTLITRQYNPDGRCNPSFFTTMVISVATGNS